MQTGPTDDLITCLNEGTHWQHYRGCLCVRRDRDVCVDDFRIWECDGPHDYGA
jgi:hypothetical protein